MTIICTIIIDKLDKKQPEKVESCVARLWLRPKLLKVR